MVYKRICANLLEGQDSFMEPADFQKKKEKSTQIFAENLLKVICLW